VIGIQLKGRLGNQMFQYAAARTLAERIGCATLFAGNTLDWRFGLIGHYIGLDQAGRLKGAQHNGVLHAAFGHGPHFFMGRAIELASPALRRLFFPRAFSPSHMVVSEGSRFEQFDPKFFGQTSGTWLSGWFQSDKYFLTAADRVRAWFKPNDRQFAAIEAVMRVWPAAPESMASVHVRRGDYRSMKFGVAKSSWALPISYYREAFKRIPSDVRIAMFSDDPDWAAYKFADLRPWISRTQTPVLDLHLMARCRWLVTANSSFSWWAAWLNSRPDRAIFAPKYHLGWRIGQWLPGGIDVAGWTYIDVQA
jgi:hypothetical protein